MSGWGVRRARQRTKMALRRVWASGRGATLPSDSKGSLTLLEGRTVLVLPGGCVHEQPAQSVHPHGHAHNMQTTPPLIHTPHTMGTTTPRGVGVSQKPSHEASSNRHAMMRVRMRVQFSTECYEM